MSCSENSDGSMLFGMTESGFWHDTATMDTKVKHFTPMCEAYGYSAGTEKFNRCLERVITESRKRANFENTGTVRKSSQDWGIIDCTTNYHGNDTYCIKH